MASPPARGRGLKHVRRAPGRRDARPVAPRAGAWIETPFGFLTRGEPTSPPARGRGLKLRPVVSVPAAGGVAPRAGAWIETCPACWRTDRSRVAPRAGAWIETLFSGSHRALLKSPPARGRGLKLRSTRCSTRRCLSPPRAGAWIETPAAARSSRHPPDVAPRAGAWIETACLQAC